MIAPGIEPNPPITVTISPLVVSGSDNSGDSTPMAAPIMAPAMPPTTPVMTKVRPLMRGIEIPHSCAATGCCATARVAMPSLVR